MIVLWVALQSIAQKINVGIAFFLSVWWGAGAGVAARFVAVRGVLSFVGFSFVCSIIAIVLLVFELFALFEDGFSISVGKRAPPEEIDPEAATSDTASAELLQQQQQQQQQQ